VTVTLRFVVPVNDRPVAAKVIEVASSATDTLPGKVAAELLVGLKLTEVPDGAGPFSVILPVVVAPPLISGVSKVKLASAGGSTLSGADLLIPALLATMFGTLWEATSSAVTWKVVLVAF